MHLWNDYEGKTVAGQWTLGRLLRTEGRSALFATTHEAQPVTLRLTEALNDQAVLRERYASIQAAGDKYLVRIEEFGDAELDGTPLSYAVIEPTQESLADIVATRKLSPEETQEVATSVAGGLRALHAQGLVHGLVEPESVLAAGDSIKLRSDCARPAPAPQDADLEGVVTPRSDAVGLAGVIYRALTQGRLRDASDALQLPEPFAGIVRNTLRGTWGVSEIGAELMRAGRTAQPGPPASAAVTTPVADAPPAPSLGRTVAERAIPEKPVESVWQQPSRVAPERRKTIGIVAAVVVLILILFALFHHGAPKPAVSSAATQTQQAPRIPAAAPRVAAPRAAAAAAPVAAPARLGGPVWRVVAFTYNHKDQAQAKADSINRHFHGFHAAVWSRSGSRPFLVTLDGALTQKQAYGLRDHARSIGVARDVYAQDYSH
jgi:hypothetical protein